MIIKGGAANMAIMAQRIAVLFLAWATIALLIWAGWQLRQDAPRGWRAEQVSLSTGGEPVAVTASMLGQVESGSDPDPVRFWLRRPTGGGWQIAVDFDSAPVRLSVGGKEQDLRLAPLKAGDRIVTQSGTWLEMVSSTPETVQFRTSDGRNFRWSRSARSLQIDGLPPLERCDKDVGAIRQWFSDFPQRLSYLLQDEDRLTPWFTIGGEVNCPDRLSLPGAERHGLLLFGSGDRVMVRQLRPDYRLMRKAGDEMALYRPWTRLPPLTGLILSTGGVRYQVGTEAGRLLLRPLENRRLLTRMPAEMPNALVEVRAAEAGEWLGAGHTLNVLLADPMVTLSLSAGALLGGLVALFCWLRLSRLTRTWGDLFGMLPVSMGLGLGLAGLGVCMVQPGNDLTVPLLVMAGLWALLALALATGRTLQPYLLVHFYTALLLAGASSLLHLQLAMIMATERFATNLAKTAMAWSVVLILCIILRLASKDWLIRTVHGFAMAASWGTLKSGWRLLLLVVVAGCLGVHLLDALNGREAGNGVQASQFNSTLYLACLSILGLWLLQFASINQPAAAWVGSLGRLWPVLLVPVCVFGLLALCHDASPMLMLAVSTVGLTVLLWFCLRRELSGRKRAHWVLFLPTLCLALLGLSVGGLLAWGDVGELTTLAGGDTGVSRFEIHDDPCGDPRGEQVCRAGMIVAQVKEWLDKGGLFPGNLTSTAPDTIIRRMPVIESDMIVSLILHKGGLLALVILALLLLAQVGSLGAAAWKGLTATVGPLEQRLAARFLGLLAAALALHLSQHVLIGLSNGLGWFPLMGNPLSFLSYGGAHLVFVVGVSFLLPGLLARLTEEPAPVTR